MSGVLAMVEKHRRVVEWSALLLVWATASTLLAIWYSGRIRDWSVMTDELQYAKLATAIADSYSPVPTLHETSVSILNQLYPLLIAPLYGLLSPPSAFRAAHVWNAVVMASAVIPAYLLGRQALTRAWAFAVAVLSTLVPWMVLAGFLMTEVVAYPAFLWAILGLQLAIAAPSPRSDLLAAGAIALAVLARTQFAVLALVLPLAILGHELGQALASRGTASVWRTLVATVVQTLRRHWLLAALYVVAGASAVVVAVLDSAGSLLGTYSVTVEEGSILPSDMWSAAAKHIDAVAIGCGIVPLLLGGGWMLAAVVRPQNSRERAFATLSLVTVVLLTLETASYNVRFGGADVVRDRYLFYVVPLLLIGTAAALSGAPRRYVAAGAAAVAVFFAATVSLLPFTTFEGVSVDSPPSVLNDFLSDQSGSLGTGTFVALVGLLLGVAVIAAVLFAPRAPLALVLFVALAAFSILTLRSEVDRIVTGTGLTGRPLAGPPGLVLDWVDSVVPDDETAASIPFPLSSAWDTSAIRWWDVEFWNRSITDTYVGPGGNFTYTPFPSHTLEIDWSTGRIPGTADAPAYVVTAPGDPRFALAGSRHASNLGFDVIAVDRPYRAAWASRGLETDGWTSPGRPVTIRVYARPGEERELIVVRLTVQAPEGTPALYRISAPDEDRAGPLFAGAAREEVVSVCVPARGLIDLTLTGWSNARIDGPPLGPEIETTRRVGVGVSSISVAPTGHDCPVPAR